MQTKDVSDETIYAAIRESKKKLGAMPQDYLPEIPFKVVMSKMERMVNQGKLDYGVSLQTAWIVADQERLKNRTWRDEMELLIPKFHVKGIVETISTKLHPSGDFYKKPKDE